MCRTLGDLFGDRQAQSSGLIFPVPYQDGEIVAPIAPGFREDFSEFSRFEQACRPWEFRHLAGTGGRQLLWRGQGRILGNEANSSLSAPCLQDLAAIASSHAGTEAMSPNALDSARLKGSFHRRNSAST